MSWAWLADQVLGGRPITREQALLVLRTDDVHGVLEAAYAVRREHRGRRVRLHVLCNAKSGLCPEDCAFCSQSAVARSDIARYRLMNPAEIFAAAERARRARAYKFCIVLASRGPNDHEMDTICEAVARIKREIPVNV